MRFSLPYGLHRNQGLSLFKGRDTGGIRLRAVVDGSNGVTLNHRASNLTLGPKLPDPQKKFKQKEPGKPQAFFISFCTTASTPDS